MPERNFSIGYGVVHSDSKATSRWWVITLNITAIFMITVMASCVRVSHSETKEFEAYLSRISTVLERHADTTEQGNAATLRFQQQLPLQASLPQAMRLLDEYIAKLEWAIPRLRADVDEAQRVTAPKKALPFHNKLIEAFVYDFAGISGLRGYYVGLKTTGVNDTALLNHSNDQLLKGRLASIEAKTMLHSLAAK
jgi:hypothetical protein